MWRTWKYLNMNKNLTFSKGHWDKNIFNDK